jgi:hypothetical protein
VAVLEIVKKLVQESGGWKKIEKALEEVPKKALEYFKAQYYGLAMKYPEFAIWLNLQESERDRIQLRGEIIEYSRKLIELAESGQKTIDIGFKQMEKVINSIPLQIEQRQIDAVLQRLETWYTNTVNQPIIDDPEQALTYPKKSEIFIPQAFQVLHYTGEERLEHDQTWRDLPVRDDLSAFLLSYFNHPISVNTPLIILGQPGSGKSLLTSMLAARLIVPASSYTPIRVELRHINTEASIPVQIKDQVYKDTSLERSWGELANSLMDRPPLVLFDGYDELLQATGKVFSGYLKDVEAFQTVGRDLPPAEKMFGSFFFQKLTAVHKSVGPTTVYKPREKEEDAAYEFLHNTFGEFLTADFMLRKILEETAAIHHLTRIKVFRSTLSQKIEQLDGVEPGWYARFIYAPLFSRPVIVNLLREWSRHCLRQEQRDVEEFLADLDTIVTNHINLLLTTSTLPSLMAKSDQHLFADLPIIGYLAIYTLNLLLLRTLLAPDGYIFDEAKYTPSVDGTRAWDRLTYLWRSWFSLETLNALAAILTAERDNTTIHLKIKRISGPSARGDRLNLVYNVGQTLADDIVAGLSGFLLHDSFRTEMAELDKVSKMLCSEQLSEPLTVDLFTKQLRHLRRETPTSITELDTISKELRFDPLNKKQPERVWSFNLESSASSLAEITRLAQRTNDPRFLEIFHYLVVGPRVAELDDELTEEAIKLARETNFDDALQFFGARHLNEILAKEPSATLLMELIKAAQGSGIPAILQYIRQEYLEKAQNNQRYIPMPLATQMIKFAHEVGDQAILDYFSQEYIKTVLKSQEHITIELAIEMIKLARETGNQETLSQLIKKCTDFLEIRLHDSVVVMVDVQFAALIIELLKAAYEMDNQQVPKTLVTFVKRSLEQEEGSQYLLPNLVATILKFAHKINDQELMDYLKISYLPTALLRTQEQVPVELAVELIKLAQEQEYLQADIERYYHKNITAERCHLGLLPLDTIIDIRRLARVFGDDKLAQQIDTELGL